MKNKFKLILTLTIITLLLFSGCMSSNSSDTSTSENNQVTLEMHTKMFDFSTGEIVTEMGTTEDIDVITGAKEGFVRLLARNSADLMIIGDADYALFVDVFEGATCELIDRQGGKATFTVNSIGVNMAGAPTVNITWNYIY